MEEGDGFPDFPPTFGERLTALRERLPNGGSAEALPVINAANYLLQLSNKGVELRLDGQWAIRPSAIKYIRTHDYSDKIMEEGSRLRQGFFFRQSKPDIEALCQWIEKSYQQEIPPWQRISEDW